MNEPGGWTAHGKVRARLAAGGGLEVSVDGLTTQGKYYKPLVREFFRKRFGAVRPAWGEFEVHIRLEYTGDPPQMDIDNLAKALLDAITGVAYVDDSQVARLLVERAPGERERVRLLARPYTPPAA
jgi:Holliday junction resolvase RusA-like endonuclease